MHPVRRRKMLKVLLVVFVLSLVTGLVLYALRQNISLFYTPTELAAGLAPQGASIRLGGMVREGSIVREGNLKVRFQITDYHDTISVVYQGILPDLFREGKGIVAQGMWLGDKRFQATTVLAKHDENYMPPEVKGALEKYKKAKPPLPSPLPLRGEGITTGNESSFFSASRGLSTGSSDDAKFLDPVDKPRDAGGERGRAVTLKNSGTSLLKTNKVTLKNPLAPLGERVRERGYFPS